LPGSSFITDNKGAVLAKADRTSETIIYADLDLEAYARERAGWGLFRDRRPDLYGALLTKDGHTSPS
jgi:N-carbamoylputrescine amidase